MGTKTISLREDAYNRLKDHKREGESFTDVVNRLTTTEADPLDSAGTFPGLASEADRDELREQFDEDVTGRERELFGQ
ncbi:antitoxin VapB family protein [Natrialbaceae archaeon A-arb3/5]